MMLISGSTFWLFAAVRLSSHEPSPLVDIARISRKALCRCIPSFDKSALSRTKMRPLLSACVLPLAASLLRLRLAPSAWLGLLWFVTYQSSYGALISSRLYRKSNGELTTSAPRFQLGTEAQV